MPDPLLSLLQPTSSNVDGSTLFDALAFVQAPATANQLIELLAAGGIRTARGAGFHNNEVRRLLDQLRQQGVVSQDTRGRWTIRGDTGWQRFRELVQSESSRTFWWRAWSACRWIERSYNYGAWDATSLAGAMRVAIHAARSAEAFNDLSRRIGTSGIAAEALRQALLVPFDAELLDALPAAFAAGLAGALLGTTMGGDADAAQMPLLDWLLAHTAKAPQSVPEHLHYRLAETLLFRGSHAEARALLARFESPESRTLEGAIQIAEGRFGEGIETFDAAWKALASTTGKRKALLPPSITWTYTMALLAQPEPAAWIKARKFAAAEAGKREAQPTTYWGIWQSAIDQRLGDAPKDANHFRLTPTTGYRHHALEDLHHLLLAAWVRVEPKGCEGRVGLRAHGANLEARYRDAGLLWLAQLARRGTAQLLGEPPAVADAALPFFIGAPQDRWREALASIVALGTGSGGKLRDAGVPEDRLIWTVKVDAKTFRITAIEALEQKAGPRGLGKPKPVTVAALLKRKDLPAHDAAVLRAVRREDFGSRAFLDLAPAAAALLRHPHVAWASDPQTFVEVTESLPALEVMTRGEQIAFRIVDPVHAGEDDEDEDEDEDEDDEDDDDFDFSYASPRMRRSQLQARQTLLIPDGAQSARLLRITPAQRRVAELVSQGWQVPVDAKDELDAALRVLATHFQLASDAETGTEVPASDVLRAELAPRGAGIELRIVAAPFGDFGPRVAPGGGRTRMTTVHRGVTLYTQRQLDGERARLLALTRTLDFLDDGEHAWAIDDAEQALATVEALAKAAPGVVSEWPKGKPLRVRALAPQALKMNVTSRGDWFALDGELQLDGGEVLRLSSLLALVAQGRSRYVALGDGDFIVLGDALRQQLADLHAIAQPHKDGQRVAAVAALAWMEHSRSEALRIAGDLAFQKRIAAWSAAQQRTFDVPGTLQAELRDYQLAGYRWLMRLASAGFGACLADDMGLGKTLMTLAVLLERAAAGAALVVAPTSVTSNWLAEAARFAPALDVQLYGGTGDLGDAAAADDDDGAGVATAADDDHRAGAATAADCDDRAGAATATAGNGDDAVAALSAAADNARLATRRRQVRALGPGQVLVCSYALLAIDADILCAREWHSAVLDEAQAVKNPATRRAKAASRLQADWRVALTGTPIENRLGELWSIMDFANPGLLGTTDQFTQRFAAPIERGGDAQASRRLRRLVSPFLLRRTKGEVLSDLPPRTEIVHEVVPGKRERALLEALRREAEASIDKVIAAGTADAKARIHVLAALMKLRRAACDPRLVVPELGNQVGAKVQEFERLALELVAGRHKALVFSQFTDFLALLRERLDAAGLAYQYLDGSTPAAERGLRVAAFQRGEGDFFLISLKAGGFGLNLTLADYVIIADPWWNPAAEDQASGRAHRIGQQRPVTVYRLVTKGSIEERIVKLHRSKRELAQGILDGQDGGAAPVNAGELMALLRGEPVEA